MTAAETTTQAPLMTDEQKFFFDLRGWIMIPSVLSPDEIEEMKAEIHAGAKNAYEGKLQTLLDHSVIVGILTEILSEDPFVNDEAYSFRCENSFTTIRPAGWKRQDVNGTGMPQVNPLRVIETSRRPSATLLTNSLRRLSGWMKSGFAS